MVENRFGRRRRLFEGAMGVLQNFVIDLAHHLMQGLLVDDAFLNEESGEGDVGVAGSFFFALVFGLVGFFVVAVGVRIGADDMGVDKRRSMAFAAPGGGGGHGAPGGDEVG